MSGKARLVMDGWMVWSVQVSRVRWRHSEEAEGCEGEEGRSEVRRRKRGGVCSWRLQRSGSRGAGSRGDGSWEAFIGFMGVCWKRLPSEKDGGGDWDLGGRVALGPHGTACLLAWPGSVRMETTGDGRRQTGDDWRLQSGRRADDGDGWPALRLACRSGALRGGLSGGAAGDD